MIGYFQACLILPGENKVVQWSTVGTTNFSCGGNIVENFIEPCVIPVCPVPRDRRPADFLHHRLAHRLLVVARQVLG